VRSKTDRDKPAQSIVGELL